MAADCRNAILWIIDSSLLDSQLSAVFVRMQGPLERLLMHKSMAHRSGH